MSEVSTSRIACAICGAKVHAIQTHLRTDHPEMTLEEYRNAHPDAPLLSDLAIAKLKERSEDTSKESVTSDASKVALHLAFNLGNGASGKNRRQEAIMIRKLPEDADSKDFVPEVDNNYVFEPENLKNAVMAIELNIPLMVWGHAGTGKTTLLEQIAARTNRPAIRVQHTINTEESQIVGQWVAKGGETLFEMGPLPTAMRNGWLYIADEYDFALPSVLAVYQAVLEGKPLMIKEADAPNRLVKPHPNFRFVATGNTNGSGDETGLYQGTNVQNAANYDRFRMVIEMQYMKAQHEIKILVNQTRMGSDSAKKLVDFANRVRESYQGQKISSPISPRTLIAAGLIGLRKGSFREGLSLAYANKLNRVDKEVVESLAQRIFGDESL